VTQRAPLLLAACALALFAGCTVGDVVDELAGDLFDTPFGVPTAAVSELDGETLGELLSEVNLRVRSYLDLRAAIPIEVLGEDPSCVTASDGDATSISLTVDVACAFPDQPGAGAVSVSQTQTAADPVQVLETLISYDEVQVGLLLVDGTEQTTETLGDDPVSQRTLNLTQAGFDFAYTFRLSLAAGGDPVFDYELELPDGPVLIRITSPTTPGAFATALVIGADGVLTCEIRDAAWEPGAPAKGLCDNGTSFGL
jgi:hypothetical protein